MRKQPTSLDIFPQEVFFIHDLVVKDFTVKRDKEVLYDGFYIDTLGICGATMTIYSTTPKKYKAKVTKYTLKPTKENNSGNFRATVKLDETEDEKGAAKVLDTLNKLSHDDLKALAVEAANKVADAGDQSMKELYMLAAEPGKVKGFILVIDEKFTAILGTSDNVVDFIHETVISPTPWDLMQKLENNRVGA